MQLHPTMMSHYTTLQCAVFTARWYQSQPVCHQSLKQIISDYSVIIKLFINFVFLSAGTEEIYHTYDEIDDKGLNPTKREKWEVFLFKMTTSLYNDHDWSKIKSYIVLSVLDFMHCHCSDLDSTVTACSLQKGTCSIISHSLYSILSLYSNHKASFHSFSKASKRLFSPSDSKT